MAWDQLRSSYDHIAGKYETRFLDELNDKPRDPRLLTEFAASASDPVIEIGCGPGQIGFYVRERGRCVVGLDASGRMAKLATARLDGALIADIRALPLASQRIGGIVAFYSLIHIRRSEVATVLEEIHRVLRPGGRVLFSAHEGRGEIGGDEFLDEPVPFVATLFELDELVDASEAAGLVVTHAERRMPYAAESTVRLYVAARRPTALGGSAATAER